MTDYDSYELAEEYVLEQIHPITANIQNGTLVVIEHMEQCHCVPVVIKDARRRWQLVSVTTELGPSVDGRGLTAMYKLASGGTD